MTGYTYLNAFSGHNSCSYNYIVAMFFAWAKIPVAWAKALVSPGQPWCGYTPLLYIAIAIYSYGSGHGSI